jgi:glutamate 5-kinase
VTVAQVLVTRDDFENPERRKNAQSTLLSLIAEKVIPIINENDTVAVEEIRMGDNDNLAARVATKVQADLLVLLTDVDGLMTRPPQHGKGKLIPHVDRITVQIESLAHDTHGTDGGTGGMRTKISAARLATRRGVPMVIANGRRSGLLIKVVRGQPAGTFFSPNRLN